jgi:hypothetical protein
MKKKFIKIKVPRLISCIAGFQILCLVLIWSLPSCKKDFRFDKVKDLSWNPDVALPLVNDSITLEKVLTAGENDDNIDIDESGNISILYYYNNDAFRLRPKDLIKIPPVSFSMQHQVTPVEQAALGFGDITTPPDTIALNIISIPGDTRVDVIEAKSIVMKVNSNNTFSNPGYMVVKFLNATQYGKPFSDTIGPFVPGQVQTNKTLKDVRFDLTSSPNLITAVVTGYLKRSGSPVAGDMIQSGIQLSFDTIGWFEGFLGHQSFAQMEDTVKVNVFNNAYALGEVYFMDPQASVTIVNSIGIPAEVTIEKMAGINNASGLMLDIADRLGAGAFITVPSPLINATHSVIKTMDYTNANTGNAMNDFFNLKPDKAVFRVNMEVNPAGTVSNFFSDTSSFYADLRIKLPLWGHFDHLTFQDTFDLVIDKPEELEHLEFRTTLRNGLPLTALMQVYFVDQNYVIKDSLAGDDQIFIREAPVDPSTDLPYPGVYGEKDTVFILNMDRMQNLKNVKKALVKAVLHSANGGQQNVKLKAKQMLKINFSARAKLRKTIELSK